MVLKLKSLIKPLDNKSKANKPLGAIRFSKLRAKIVGSKVMIEVRNPISFTRKSIIAAIFSFDASKTPGYFRKASQISSSDKPHFLKTSNLLSIAGLLTFLNTITA
ncbi:hypothetical protein GQ457_13G026680 [Hibiscus cannabinus]